MLPAELGTVLGEEATLRLHRGQARAHDSLKRFILVLAGTQSGKTVYGPWWLHREISERGPGDYLIVGAYANLLQFKVIPAFRRVFEGVFKLGEYVGSPTPVFRFTPEAVVETCGVEGEVNVFFGHAGNPESLESATAKAAWLDEAGQTNFRLGSWEAIQRRLAIHQGRVLITTTPYNLGWLKQQLYDPWEESGRDHPEIDVINFRSIDNPTFPEAEWVRMSRELPPWKFQMYYGGKFTRPAGLIYDCFNRKTMVVPRYAVPPEWPRYAGIDFGAVNTAAVFFAEKLHPISKQRYHPTKFVAYREYRPGKIPPQTHAVKLMAGDPQKGIPPEPSMPRFVGGSRSEDDWRERFAEVSVPIDEPPKHLVEAQIDAFYELIYLNQVEVMDDLVGLLDELGTYSRVIDESGKVTEKIDEDQLFHFLASCRYWASWIKESGLAGWIPSPDDPNMTAAFPVGAFEPDFRESQKPRHEEADTMGSGGYDDLFPAWVILLLISFLLPVMA